MDDISFDNGRKEHSLSVYSPVVIEVSSPDDTGNYLISVQTSNEKLKEVLCDLAKNNPHKFTITTNSGPDSFFGELKIMDQKEFSKGEITNYSLSIGRITT